MKFQFIIFRRKLATFRTQASYCTLRSRLMFLQVIPRHSEFLCRYNNIDDIDSRKKNSEWSMKLANGLTVWHRWHRCVKAHSKIHGNQKPKLRSLTIHHSAQFWCKYLHKDNVLQLNRVLGNIFSEKPLFESARHRKKHISCCICIWEKVQTKADTEEAHNTS
jgi:hypothetical protein